MNIDVAEAAAVSIASKTTTAGAATSMIGFALSSEFGVLVGMIAAIAGLIVNAYYRKRRDRREQEEHQARMEAIRAGVKQ